MSRQSDFDGDWFYRWSYQDDLEECAECGHLHFDEAARVFYECPIEGCGCPYAQGEM